MGTDGNNKNEDNLNKDEKGNENNSNNTKLYSFKNFFKLLGNKI